MEVIRGGENEINERLKTFSSMDMTFNVRSVSLGLWIKLYERAVVLKIRMEPNLGVCEIEKYKFVYELFTEHVWSDMDG